MLSSKKVEKQWFICPICLTKCLTYGDVIPICWECDTDMIKLI